MCKEDGNNGKGASSLSLAILSVFMLAALVFFSVFLNHGVEASNGCYPPYPPILESPRDGTTGVTEESVILMWRGAERYRSGQDGGITEEGIDEVEHRSERYYQDGEDHLTIDNYWLKVSTRGPPNSDGSVGDVFDGQLGQTTSKMIFVDQGTKYFWAVKAHDYDGWSPWSQFYTFTPNSPPRAEIRLVSPSPAREGQEITMRGTAEDPDGDDIISYLWESDLDGELGASANVERAFTKGEHTLTFRAQDGNGIWSEAATFDLTVNENNPPSEVNSITPSETHDLQPEISWPGASDPEGDDFVYHVSVGTSYEVFNDIVDDTETEYTRLKIQKKLSYGEEGEPNDYVVTIYTEDEYGAISDTTQHMLSVINHPPEAPSIAITPMEPYSDNDLSVSLTKESKDEDGDEIKWPDDYEIYWSKDDGKGAGPLRQSSLDNQHFVPARLTVPGDVWNVEVTPTDGIDPGRSARAEVEIYNYAPDIVISKPKNADEDDDGDPDDENEDGIPDVYFLTTEVIDFDASKSEDKDEEALDFEWDFGDDNKARGAKVEHQYAEPGTYEVFLTVTDESGEEAEESIMVVVQYPPPEVSVTNQGEGTVSIYEGETQDVGVFLLVKNTGEAPLDGAKVRFYDINNNVYAEVPLKTVQPGKSTTVQSVVEVNKAGRMKIEVVDENGNGLDECYLDVRTESRPGPGAWWENPVTGGILGIFAFVLLLVLAALVLARKRRLEYYEDYYAEEDEEDEDDGYGPAIPMPGDWIGATMGFSSLPQYGQNYSPGFGGIGSGLPQGQSPGLPALPGASPANRYYGAEEDGAKDMPALPGPEGREEIKSKPAPFLSPLEEAGFKAFMAEEEQTTPLLPLGRDEDVGGEVEESDETLEENGVKEPRCPYCGSPVEDGWLVCINCKAMLK